MRLCSAVLNINILRMETNKPNHVFKKEKDSNSVGKEWTIRNLTVCPFSLTGPFPAIVPQEPASGGGGPCQGRRSWGPARRAALVLPVSVGAVGCACDHRALQMLNTRTIAGSQVP